MSMVDYAALLRSKKMEIKIAVSTILYPKIIRKWKDIAKYEPLLLMRA